MPKKVAIGIVTSDKMKKTRRVEIARLVKYPKYGKIVRRRTVCYVHDEEEKSAVGDTVEIIECRPMSHLKRWNLVNVVSKSKMIDISTLRGTTKDLNKISEEKSTDVNVSS